MHRRAIRHQKPAPLVMLFVVFKLLFLVLFNANGAAIKLN
jgi:hypothetical protein